MTKTVLISGCTRGIGLAVTRYFASKGFNIAGCARNEEDLKSLFSDLSTSYPGQIFFLEACDVSQKELLKIFASDALKELGKIDVLVNNAGVFIPGNLLDEPDDHFEKQISINLASAYHLSRAIAPAMILAGSGHIFNVASIASLKAYPNGGSYSITKFGMYGLSQVLREELMNKGIKVTSVLPGATLTDSWAGTSLPENRFIPSEDIARLIYNAWELSASTNVDQIIVRPTPGDI